jgi:hypothetical protein
MSAPNHSFWLLALSVLLTGCTTVTRYEAKTKAHPAKPADHPIYLYPREVRVPRPYEVIGVMEIRDTPFTMFGGSFESEIAALRERARKVGADAVQLTSVEQPDFLHAKYRMDANLIRFSEPWEQVQWTEAEFRDYLRAQGEALDPVEGIWVANDVMQSRIAIRRVKSRPDREFAAYLLHTRNPTWRLGDKKLDLVRGERPGVYRGAYYLEDYRRKSIAFSLLGARTNVFVIPQAEDEPPIVFSRE